MPIKKSDLYSSLWASCDELRGGMDASQYKDYVLFMLFIRYISDKYGNSNDFAPPVTIPEGSGAGRLREALHHAGGARCLRRCNQGRSRQDDGGALDNTNIQ
jgi:hypothetical protein